MRDLNDLIIPAELRPFCDDLLNTFVLDLSHHELYVNIFKQRFYFGTSLESLAEMSGLSLRYIKNLLPQLLFRVLIFALRKLLFNYVDS